MYTFPVYLLAAFDALAFLFLLTQFYNKNNRWVTPGIHFHTLAIYSFIPFLQFFTLGALVYYCLLSRWEDEILAMYALIQIPPNKIQK